MENIIRSLKTTAISFIMCVSAFVLYIIHICVIPEKIAVMNPFLSGFLHQSLEHLLLNMVILFIGLLHPINKKINWKSIFIVTLVISLSYLPVSILGITPFSIGLSGTCYFFLTRATINWGIIGKIAIFLLFFFEFLSLFLETNTAHGVHLIGIIFGFLSLQIISQKKVRKIPDFFKCDWV